MAAVTARRMHTLVVSVLIVLMLVWLAWVAISAYQLLKTPGVKTPGGRRQGCPRGIHRDGHYGRRQHRVRGT